MITYDTVEPRDGVGSLVASTGVYTAQAAGLIGKKILAFLFSESIALFLFYESFVRHLGVFWKRLSLKVLLKYVSKDKIGKPLSQQPIQNGSNISFS